MGSLLYLSKIDGYHQLWRIEGLPDVEARPARPTDYHHLRDSIEAHLSIVVTAMAVSHYIENQTGWSIEKLVCAARRYRTVKVKAGRQLLAAAKPVPEDLRDAIIQIGVQLKHKIEPTREGFHYGNRVGMTSVAAVL